MERHEDGLWFITRRGRTRSKETMRILLVAEDWRYNLTWSVKNALTALGFSFKVFDYRREMREYWGPVPQSETPSVLLRIPGVRRIIRELQREWNQRRMNRRLVQQAESYQPDAVLVLKGEHVFPSSLVAIRQRTGAKLLNWNGDNPFNLMNSSRYLLNSIPIYDCLFIWGKCLIEPLYKAGARRVEYLPFGYEPAIHHPVSVTEEERQLLGNDVVFVGTWEPPREAILSQLLDFDLAIWGNSWEHLALSSPLRECVRGRARYGEEMAKILNASKICLNFIRKQNGNAHNMRTFEIPACGAFMLTTRTKEQCEFFAEGEEIACFGDVAELRQQISCYLEHPQKITAIAKRSHERVLHDNHAYVDRMRFVLAITDELR